MPSLSVTNAGMERALRFMDSLERLLEVNDMTPHRDQRSASADQPTRPNLPIRKRGRPKKRCMAKPIRQQRSQSRLIAFPEGASVRGRPQWLERIKSTLRAPDKQPHIPLEQYYTREPRKSRKRQMQHRLFQSRQASQASTSLYSLYRSNGALVALRDSAC